MAIVESFFTWIENENLGQRFEDKFTKNFHDCQIHLSNNPDQSVQLFYAYCLWHQRSTAESMAQFKLILQDDANNLVALACLHQIYVDLGRATIAEQYASQLAGVQFTPQLLANQAWAKAYFYTRLYMYNDALACYQAAEQSMPDQYEFKLYQAILYNRQKKYHLAYQKANEADELMPNNRLILLHKARAAEGNGNRKHARVLYEAALAIAPDDENILKFYGKFLKKTGKHEKAKHIFKASIESRPTTMALHNSGRQKLKSKSSKKRREGVQELKQAISLNPRNHFAYVDLLRGLFKLSEYGEILNVSLSVDQIFSGSDQAKVQQVLLEAKVKRARALIKLDDIDAGVTELHAVLSAYPPKGTAYNEAFMALEKFYEGDVSQSHIQLFGVYVTAKKSKKCSEFIESVRGIVTKEGLYWRLRYAIEFEQATGNVQALIDALLQSYGYDDALIDHVDDVSIEHLLLTSLSYLYPALFTDELNIDATIEMLMSINFNMLLNQVLLALRVLNSAVSQRQLLLLLSRVYGLCALHNATWQISVTHWRISVALISRLEAFEQDGQTNELALLYSVLGHFDEASAFTSSLRLHDYMVSVNANEEAELYHPDVVSKLKEVRCYYFSLVRTLINPEAKRTRTLLSDFVHAAKQLIEYLFTQFVRTAYPEHPRSRPCYFPVVPPSEVNTPREGLTEYLTVHRRRKKYMGIATFLEDNPALFELLLSVQPRVSDENRWLAVLRIFRNFNEHERSVADVEAVGPDSIDAWQLALQSLYQGVLSVVDRFYPAANPNYTRLSVLTLSVAPHVLQVMSDRIVEVLQLPQLGPIVLTTASASTADNPDGQVPELVGSLELAT